MLVKTAVTLLIAVTAVAALATTWQEQEIQEDTVPFMQQKLNSSRDIVSGLALEDFDMIAKSAQDLMLLSHEADWNVLTTPEYLKMSADFRDSAERLRDSASEKNLDGSTLAYFEVTLNCVRCHKYIRTAQPESNQKEEK